MDQKKFGEFIKDLRKKHNLTQKDLADKYNVTYQAVSKWENGINLPDISLIKQICEDYNINLNDEKLSKDICPNCKSTVYEINYENPCPKCGGEWGSVEVMMMD